MKNKLLIATGNQENLLNLRNFLLKNLNYDCFLLKNLT